jgi:RimJ/RimL family protein N-acetyltransferase
MSLLVQTHKVSLLSATPQHAGFILGLRLNEALNQHLSSTSSSLAEQEAWLAAYQEREALGQEFYFIIQADGHPQGTVRLYKITQDSFTWGSWMLQPNAPFYCGLSSALMVYEFAFHSLHKTSCQFDVRKANTKVIQLHLKLGATPTHEDEENVYFTYSPKAYEPLRKQYAKWLTGFEVKLQKPV